MCGFMERAQAERHERPVCVVLQLFEQAIIPLWQGGGNLETGQKRF